MDVVTDLEMSEAEFQAAVRQQCSDLSLVVYHTHNSRKSDKGFPDLVILGRRGLLFRELKTMKGKPTPEQRFWILALRSAGFDAGLWRPDQLRTDVPVQLWRLGRVDPSIPRPAGI